MASARNNCPKGTRKNRKTGVSEPHPKSPTRKNKPSNQQQEEAYNSIVIIQHSCDPLPLEGAKDLIYKQRLSCDAQGLRNAQFIWDYLKKQKPSKQKSSEDMTPLVNEDFTVIREVKGQPPLPPQGFYEYSTGAGDEKKLINAQKKLVKKTKPAIDPRAFIDALTGGTIIYLPIHGGHPLDFDEHSVDTSQFILPDNIYVMSFNPPNSDALFLCGEAEQEFLEFVSHPESLLMLTRKANHKRRFESEFYKNMRVWGPTNSIMNRGIVSDRGADLMRRPASITPGPFQYLRKSQFRTGLEHDLEDLYTELVEAHSGNTV